MNSSKTRPLSIILLCIAAHAFGIGHDPQSHISAQPQQYFTTNRPARNLLLERYTAIVRNQGSHTPPLHDNLITLRIIRPHLSHNINQRTMSGLR